jgi:hypothetical protein
MKICARTMWTWTREEEGLVRTNEPVDLRICGGDRRGLWWPCPPPASWTRPPPAPPAGSPGPTRPLKVIIRTCTHTSVHIIRETTNALVESPRRNTKVHAVCKGNKVICNHTDVMDFFRKFRSWTRPVLKNLKRNELYFSVHYYLSPIWM